MNDYESFIEELKATITEEVFNLRWGMIELKHKVGLMITSRPDVTVQKVAKDSGLNERDLQRCVQFYIKYPDINALPDGKNISWHKVVNQLLPEHKEVEEEHWLVCDRCGGKGKIREI